MPIYEFECCACGNKFERITKLLDWTVCPRCGHAAALVPSAPRLNTNFPAQQGGVHSMAGFGKRARFREGED